MNSGHRAGIHKRKKDPVNFIFALRSENCLVAGVNAHDAKKQRENMQASTDRLDLMGIYKK